MTMAARLAVVSLSFPDRQAATATAPAKKDK